MTSIVKNIQLPNGVRLPYMEEGDPAAIPVVFLHGFTGSWREFEPIFGHLPKSVHAVALTQRGHGDASHPNSGYRLDDFSGDLLEFMKAKGIREALIVGHSMGSAVAQRFAVDNPDQSLGLVLAGASIAGQGDPKVQEFFDSTISRLVDPIDPNFVRQFSASMRVKEITEELFEMLVQDALKVPARVWIQAFEGRLSERISEELERIMCPTLLLWGDQDHRSLRSDQNALLGAIPDSRLEVYQGAGHLLHLEEPGRFASDIAAFAEDFISKGDS
jgi:pimeloyl-ACP methyl ester carboxylesterase